MIMSSVPDFHQDKLPFRVIDVSATLCSKGRIRFCEAGTWDFSVISHVWNKHVCGMMETIKAAAGELKCTYPEAVEQLNLGDLKAYAGIRKFLRVVHQQGVNKVWMDTLCIDQSNDSKEKGREIPLMGAYYRHSAACYVPLNGFGFKHTLSMGKEVTENLRWLNRVWTLQEFLLPDRRYFLVELQPWMEEWLALRVATAEEELTHFCSCCIKDLHFFRQILEKMTLKMEGVPCKLERVRDTDPGQICSRCASPPLLRRAGKQAQGAGNELYLVLREALFVVALLAEYHVEIQGRQWEESPDARDARYQMSKFYAPRNSWLLRVMHARRLGIWFSTFEILNEVRRRQCTVPRDRVLGLLGLLGVNLCSRLPNDGLKFTADTPEEQLIQLASQGAFSQQMLVEMCWADSYREKPGMSWLPELEWSYVSIGNVSQAYDQGMRHFDAIAKNVSVSPLGFLTFSVKVVKGYAVRCQERKNLLWTAEGGESLGFDLDKRATLKDCQGEYHYFKRFSKEQVQEFNAESRELLDRSFNVSGDELTFDERGSVKIRFKEWNKFRHFSGFEMWLLLLGYYRGKGCVLLCIPTRETASSVYKIGTMHATYLGWRQLFDSSNDPLQEVTIGSSGEYVDDQVDYFEPSEARRSAWKGVRIEHKPLQIRRSCKRL